MKTACSQMTMIVALLVLPLSSQATTLTRTWVSAAGSDSNACTRTAPCLTFAGAILKTSPGGEINCVDAGDYGAVTINGSITIDCSGAFGSMIVGNGSGGITIQAGINGVVTIRNLSIRGEQGAVVSTGIVYLSAKAVHVENVVVSNMASECIAVAIKANEAGLLTLDNATLTDCGNHGVSVATNSTTSGQAAVANINNTRISNTSVGVEADNGSRVTIRDSTIYFNTRGVDQSTVFGTALGSTVTIVNSTLGYSNEAAVKSLSGDFILVFGNTFVNDVLALSPNGGMIFTGSDNINSGSSQGTANGGSAPKF